MTQYLLSVYEPDMDPPPAEFLDPIMRKVGAWSDELKAAGAWVFTARLHRPHTATVVHAKGEEILTTDGPFVEGKEFIGGFTVIDVPDLDAALGWARKFTEITTLPLEVRPFRDAG
ncbi:MAG TPA: YciI family protein [Actinokineospora sp.]|nr:YciI family protein [Actinokineospora sp.]